MILNKTIARRLDLEPLETRLNLSGSTVTSCVFDAGEAVSARAATAVNCLATDLYEQFQREDGNLLFSPLSISTALAMTYLGAANQTAAEMEQVLHLGDTPGIHESFRALLESLDKEGNQFHPQLANALWTQIGYPFLPAFLDGIQANYSGYAQGVDYEGDPEQARQVINDWVADRTQNKIDELIPTGVLDELTRIVLTNSIYYKADWAFPFAADATIDRPFTYETGETVDVPTMSKTEAFLPYTVQSGFEVLELPYALGPLEEGAPVRSPGTMSMIILLPGDGQRVDDLTPEMLADVSHWLDSEPESKNVDVLLPKFKTTVASDLKEVLKGMGAGQMFNPVESDFSNMTVDSDFHITDVLHEAFLEINEHGTEAAAATAVVGGILCFAKGTPVLTSTGEKPIETLVAGDLVLSRNEHNLEAPLEPKQILEVFENQSEIVTLHVGGHVIRTTKAHPFFVQGRGWTAACELQTGHCVATDQDWIEVEQVLSTGEVETVYNFHVEDHRTYFVGSEAWGFHVWAHNACGIPLDTIKFNADHPFHFMIRDNETSTILFMGRVEDPLQRTNSLVPTFEETDRPEPSERLAGDADGNGAVDFADFLVLSQNFGKTDAVFADGDFDGNQVVDFSDFLLLQVNFGASRDAMP